MPGRRPRIAIASDLSLVAETVRTALASRGYDCPLAPWPTAAPRSVDAGLLICELAPGDRMCEALRLVEAKPSQVCRLPAQHQPTLGASL